MRYICKLDRGDIDSVCEFDSKEKEYTIGELREKLAYFLEHNQKVLKRDAFKIADEFKLSLDCGCQSRREKSKCKKCKNGVIETGNNDLPCDCPLGDTALFNVAGINGPVTGAEIKRRNL